MTLPASARQPCDTNGARVPGVTCRAGPDRSIGIRAAHAMTLFAAAGHCRPSLHLNKGMRRPTSTARLIRFGKVHLFRRKTLLTVNSSPRRGGVTAVQKLLVNALVTTAAIARGELG